MTRTELTLTEIARRWQVQHRGEAFIEALVDFFRGIDNQHTLKSYTFSILQFFEWYAREHGRIDTPERIRRADALDFNRYLRTREHSLIRYRLHNDPSRRQDLAIFDLVAAEPGIDIEQIRRRIYTTQTLEELARRLGCLVKLRTLSRRPTIAEVRRIEGGILYVDPRVFRYYVPQIQTPDGAERASTIATRLSALSSLWSFMMRAGENVPGREDSLLRVNIWTDPLRQALKQAPSHRAATRRAKSTGVELFMRLLATTFTRTHGGAALQAAQASFWGAPVAAPRIEPSLKDVRDRALLIFMAQTGARSVEIHRLKRGHFRSPMVTLLGKRGKKRVVTVPPMALKALAELDHKLAQIAEHQQRWGHSRMAALLSSSKAPLLPAIAYWGANAGTGEAGLTRPGIAMMLRRRAIAAGIEPDSADFARAHPHGLRGLFAKLSSEAGTPIHRLQAMMGHTSAATTGRYMEESEPRKLLSEAFAGSEQLPAAPVVGLPVPAPEAFPPPPARRRPVQRPRAPKRSPQAALGGAPSHPALLRASRRHPPLLLASRRHRGCSSPAAATRLPRRCRRPLLKRSRERRSRRSRRSSSVSSAGVASR